MKCGYCENEIEPSDPAYGQIGMHADCFLKLQKDMTRYGFIFVSPSCKMQFAFTKRFNKHFNRTMNHTRLHITHDGTVSEDIIDLQGVMRAVVGFVSKDEITDRQIYLFSEIVFNGLMTQKYGSPLPIDKHFSARINEFATEVHSVETSEKELQLFRRIIKKEPSENTVSKSKVPPGMIPTEKLSNELDEELKKAAFAILDITDNLAIKIEELGASRQWRNFRKDEILLQTIEDILISHLQKSPIPEVKLSQPDIDTYSKSVKALLSEAIIRANIISKRENVPADVVLTRTLNNIIVNIINAYLELKSQYRTGAKRF